MRQGSPSREGGPASELRCVRAGPKLAGGAVRPVSGLPPGGALRGRAGLRPGTGGAPPGPTSPSPLGALTFQALVFEVRSPSDIGCHQVGCRPRLVVLRLLVLQNGGIATTPSGRHVRCRSEPALFSRSITPSPEPRVSHIF